jgi:hypothetical protein
MNNDIVAANTVNETTVEFNGISNSSFIPNDTKLSIIEIDQPCTVALSSAMDVTVADQIELPPTDSVGQSTEDVQYQPEIVKGIFFVT